MQVVKYFDQFALKVGLKKEPTRTNVTNVSGLAGAGQLQLKSSFSVNGVSMTMCSFDGFIIIIIVVNFQPTRSDQAMAWPLMVAQMRLHYWTDEMAWPRPLKCRAALVDVCESDIYGVLTSMVGPFQDEQQEQRAKTRVVIEPTWTIVPKLLKHSKTHMDKEGVMVEA